MKFGSGTAKVNHNHALSPKDLRGMMRFAWLSIAKPRGKVSGFGGKILPMGRLLCFEGSRTQVSFSPGE